MANPLAPVTLTPNTVTTFTLDGDYANVEVTNLSGDAEVWFTVDGDPPTVNGAGCEVVPATMHGVKVDAPGYEPPVVRCISAGAPRVVVRGIRT